MRRRWMGLVVGMVCLFAPRDVEARLTAEQVFQLVKTVYAQEGVNLGPTSTRESRVAALMRVVGMVHYGHVTHNATPDPAWCIKDGGPGRPTSDDVFVDCTTRDAWDFAIGVGSSTVQLTHEYLGRLPAPQQVYPPPVPASPPGVRPTLSPPVVERPRLTLTWQPPADVTPSGYVVLVGVAPGGDSLGHVPVGAITAISAPVPDGAYHVRVAAIVNGIYVASNEVFAFLGDVAPPTAPQQATAAVVGDRVTFDWQPPASTGGAPVTGYVLEADVVPGGAAIGVQLGPIVQYTPPPVPSGSYFARIRARNAAGPGASSTELHVVVGVVVPDAPVLSAGATPGGVVSVSWTTPTTGPPVTGYRLMAGTRPDASNVAVITLPAATTSFGGGGVPPGTYYVRVVAASGAGFGDVSNEVAVVVP